jgi:predicted TIM-barrel fold metal-dependent hydrolase
MRAVRKLGMATPALAALVLCGTLGSMARAQGSPRPIADTHIHLYKVTRPGGVPWPSPKNKILYRDVLPAEYKALARKYGIVSAGIVEASPLFDDNQAVLDMVKGDDFFSFLVAQVEIGSPDLLADLEELAEDPRVVGVRAFLWTPKMTLDATQLTQLRAVAAKGMTLDIVSRGTVNPKDQVSALASALPGLRIILDHLAGAKGASPRPEWELDIRRLADRHQNVFMKFSSFFDMYNPVGTEDEGWKSPTTLEAYKANFDVLMTAFGEERLIWGSNWPVSDLGGDFGQQIELAEEYLKPFGPRVRDKVMFGNARDFYRRKPPAHTAR